MLVTPRIEELVEAIADGRVPRWEWAESTAADAVERRAIGKLRALATVGDLFTAITSASARKTGVRRILSPGSVWGSLRIVEHVGRGRFGDVYRAWDPSLEREVALKLLREGAEPADSALVVDEGRLMARVRHPNVVTVYGAQRRDDVTGLWMEFVEGSTLADELGARGPFSADDIARVGSALCGALSAVHGAGVIHRDVKAQNVLRDAGGRIVLGDFGTGSELDEAFAAPGSLAGTPAYIAPEIFGGEPASAQSDIYSLGVLLYLLATGRFPVSARSLRDLRDAHAAGTRLSVRADRPDFPVQIADVIERALDSNAQRRFATADDMRLVLDRSAARRRLRSQIRSHAAFAAATMALVAATSVLTWNLRAHNTRVFDEKHWVQVADFENRTGEPVFDDGTVRVALLRELSRATTLNVVPAAAASLPSTAVNRETGEIVTRTETSRGLLPNVTIAGSIAKDGRGYVLTAGVVRATDTHVVSRFSERAGVQTQLLEAVTKLAHRIRAAAGERISDQQERQFPVSLRALQLYSQAQGLLQSTSPEDRVHGHELLNAALVDSPGFVPARMLRADYSIAERAVADADLVLAAVEPAADPEALLLVGRAYQRKGFAEAEPLLKEQAYERSVAVFEALVRLQPHSIVALQQLQLAYRSTRRIAEASALRLKFADMAPASAMAQALAALDRLENGRLDEALQYVDRARAIDPAGRVLPPWAAAWLTLVPAQSAWLRNDVATALDLTNRVAEGVPSLHADYQSQAWLHVAAMYTTLGRFAQAEAVSRMRSAEPQSESSHASLLATKEQLPALRTFLKERFSEPARSRAVTSLFIDAGLLNEARAIIAERPQLTWSAQLALAEGRIDDAIRGLTLAAQRVVELGNPAHSRLARKLAEALTLKGDVQGAARVLEEESQRRTRTASGVSFGYEWLKAREQLARLYRATGRFKEAEAIEAELRTLLSLADDDHPIKRRIVDLRQNAP